MVGGVGDVDGAVGGDCHPGRGEELGGDAVTVWTSFAVARWACADAYAEGPACLILDDRFVGPRDQTAL